MPVLNDFGEAAYQRVRQQAEQLAAAIGVQKEAIFGYFNETGHFPQTIAELENWGNTPDRIYGIRRRQPNGVWTPIVQGMQTPGKTDQDRAGFMGAGGQTAHMINNASDSDIQRFQQVDPSGNVFGGSWDPAYNAANAARMAGQTGFQTASAGLVRTASARPMDANNYVGPAPSGGGRFVSVVDGVPVEFNSQGEAEQNYNQRTGDTGSAPGGGGAGGPPAAGGAPAGGVPIGTGGGTSGGTTGGNTGINPALLNPAITLADNAAQRAYLNARLRELEIPEMQARTQAERDRIALDAAKQAWQETYQKGQLTGNLNGTPTLEATKQQADITGYTGGAVAGKGQAGMDAIAGLRQNPQYQAADGAGRRAMEAATLAQTYGIDQAAAASAVDELRALTATTGQMSTPALLESVLGRHAPGTATLARETEQNRTLLSTLGLLANLRGPENAFAYANTLANVPESIRAQIQASMGRMPVAARNPAQAGVLGDLGAGRPAQQAGAAQQPGGPGQATQQIKPVMAMTPGTVPGQPSGLPGGDLAVGGPAYAQRAAAGSADRVTGRPVMMAADPVGGLAPTFGPRTQPVTQPGLTPFHQISPTDWNNTNAYARKLTIAGYVNAGQDPEAIQDAYRMALPRAYGPRTGRLRAA